MKKHLPPLLLIGLLLAITLACRLPGLTPAPTTDRPTLTPEYKEEPRPLTEPTATEALPPTPDPTPTQPEPTPQPTTTPADAGQNAGQIAYIFGGNLWRYLVDSGQSVQVTTDGIPGDYLNSYGRPHFSPDGRYLAFHQGDRSTILDLVDNTLIDLSAYGQFFAWRGQDRQFYGVQGDFACPDIDDLDDQVLINFDILRYDLDDLANPTPLANIGGGLSFLSAISGDGEWASIVFCGCYSECGSEHLWHLPSASAVPPPMDLAAGNIDFSPDNLQLTVSQYQRFGYYQSPLYVANIDYTGMVEIFSAPDIAPIHVRWSPDGEWIAFTGVIIDDDMFMEAERCAWLIKPDGSQAAMLACDFADFITWSPDGDQLLFSQEVGSQTQYFIYDLATDSTTLLPIQVDPFFGMDWGRLP